MEVFEKIKEQLKDERLSYFLTLANTGNKTLDIAYEAVANALDKAIEIVNQVAEEYSAWKDIYAKVITLEKSYAESGDMENVNHCIRLENLLQYFKEELTSNTEEFATDTNVATNADRIRAMTDEELADFLPVASDYCCNSTDKCLEEIINHGECAKTVECALKWLQKEVKE